MRFKDKFISDGSYDRSTARLAAGGDTQPEDSYGETYVATATESNKILLLAAMHADVVHRNAVHSLHMSSFDITGAFLHVKLDKKNSPRQIVMMIDPHIPHLMAGKWIEVVGCVYGLKQSNHIFGEDFSHTILSAGFAHTTDPAILVKIDSADPSKKCVVSTHVDDGLSIHTHQPFHDQLMQVLIARYDPLTIDPEASSYIGTTLVRHPNGVFTADMKGYIERSLHDLGMDDIPGALTPLLPDNFHDSVNCSPADKALYRKNMGVGVYLLKAHHDVRKEIIHLSPWMTCASLST